MTSDARAEAVRAEKARLRRLVQTRLAGFARPDRTAADAAICEHLVSVLARQDPAFVLGYIALGDEPSITAFLAASRAARRTTLAPRVRAGRLHFGDWATDVAVDRDEKGVMAPVRADLDTLPAGRGLLVVPGRAFDPDGRRLGRGGGYYDRLLAEASQASTIVGVAYACQIVETLPSEPHDRDVHTIVTERGVREGSARRA